MTEEVGQSAEANHLHFRANAVETVRESVKGDLSKIEEPKILEAGCGSGSVLGFPDRARITGIDISEEELDKNSVVSEKIVGDLETYPLPEGKFDFAVCWDVLEHLSSPDLAMKNMAHSVKPGGTMVLKFPNVRSFKAIVAKYTPLWVHSLVNRVVYGKKAGSPGYINFPTYLRWSISPWRMHEFAENNGLDCEMAFLYESGLQKKIWKKFIIGEVGASVLNVVIKVITLGAISVRASDAVFLFRKKS